MLSNLHLDNRRRGIYPSIVLLLHCLLQKQKQKQKQPPITRKTYGAAAVVVVAVAAKKAIPVFWIINYIHHRAAVFWEGIEEVTQLS